MLEASELTGVTGGFFYDIIAKAILAQDWKNGSTKMMSDSWVDLK